MAKKIVVADTSPLIALTRIGSLALLPKLLGEIIIPKAVADECLSDMSRQDSAAIKKAITNKILKVTTNPDTVVYHNLCNILDAGEAAAIALAVKLKAGLLIDEKLGRNAAIKQNLKIIGTAGILLLAKEKRLIKKVKPLINELCKSGYFLSADLVESILKIAGEK